MSRHRRRRRFIAASVDAAAWLLALLLSTLAVYDGDLRHDAVQSMILLGSVGAAATGALGWVSGLHRGRYVVGSFDEVTVVVVTFAAASCVVLAVELLASTMVPASTVFVAGPLAIVIALTPRYALRRSRDMVRPLSATTQRLLVFGAGDAGNQIVRSVLHDPERRWIPVGFIDDDVFKRHRRIHGVPVLGGRGAIGQAASQTGADALLIAAPSLPHEVKKEVAALAYRCGLAVRALPPLSELLDHPLAARDIREISDAELLGRPPIDVDLEGVADLLRDRVVLVTGAGGSIGSEICRQVERFGPRTLIMFDRDESALHAVQLSIYGQALLTDASTVVADIRDRERVRQVFAAVQPDIVFHAAALKHLPLLQRYADEGIKTNVWGTHHVLDAAIESRVSIFVNISTDKAADPVSVLGYTKRLAERLTAEAATRSNGQFVSVRFGNVLGSRGSVLTTFRAQIEAGGPVTVTDPDVTRYFMTTEEAVKLVLQAALIGKSGEVLVFDMGTPVRIDDVARRLIAESGRAIEVRYTGLRQGEKLHECLLGADEIAVVREHRLIMHTTATPISPAALDGIAADQLAAAARGGDGAAAAVPVT